MSKRKIGIPGWVIDYKMFGVTLPYAEFAQRFGEVHILSPEMEVREDLDLLILPGGADVNPVRYGDSVKPSYYTSSPNTQLEYFDIHKLPKYIEIGMGILSICRGSQSLWTMFGGTLVQHNIYHQQSTHPKDECHGLEWTTEEYRDTYGKLIQKVNSRHHQTMDATKGIPEELEVIAYSREEVSRNNFYTDKTIVEIFKHKTLPIFGYQGHPEDMPNDRLTEYIVENYLIKK